MTKTKNTLPLWVRSLRQRMEQLDLNPRSLSLKAGLNPTAVRDMLEGRISCPRYDTVLALAEALETTPVAFMGGSEPAVTSAPQQPEFQYNLELMAEVIARLQEAIEEKATRLQPREFAAMAASIYRQVKDHGKSGKNLHGLKPTIHHLLDYENLRQRSGQK